MILFLALLTSPAQAFGTTDCVTRDESWRLVIEELVQPGPRTGSETVTLIHDNAVISRETTVTGDSGVRPNTNVYRYTWDPKTTPLKPAAQTSDDGSLLASSRDIVTAHAGTVTVTRVDQAAVAQGQPATVTLSVVCQTVRPFQLPP